MNKRREITPTANETGDTQGRLWPSPAYSQQVEKLKSAVGSKIYFVELKPSEFDMGIHLSDTAYELIAVTDFPKPDPSRGIAPHLIILDDGHGINLGHIARISVRTPFNPPADDILYQDNFLMQRLLFRERRLSKESITATSKALLARILGKPTDDSIQGGRDAIREPDAPIDSTEGKKAQQRLRFPKINLKSPIGDP